MAITEVVNLILTGAETFISAAGKQYKKGPEFVYSMSKEEADKLLSVKGDYDLRYFKKVAGTVVTKSVAADLTHTEVLPTQEEIAIDMKQDSQARYAAAVAVDRADALATASKGTESDAPAAPAEYVSKAAVVTGEIDTAVTPVPPKVRGSKAVPA